MQPTSATTVVGGRTCSLKNPFPNPFESFIFNKEYTMQRSSNTTRNSTKAQAMQPARRRLLKAGGVTLATLSAPALVMGQTSPKSRAADMTTEPTTVAVLSNTAPMDSAIFLDSSADMPTAMNGAISRSPLIKPR